LNDKFAGKKHRQGAIAEVRIVMHGVGHGYEFSVLNVDSPST
jgi:hypothetical protein